MAAIFQLRRDSGSVPLVDGELYINKGPNSLQYAVGDGNEITLAKLDELNTGSLSLSGNLTASNAYFTNNVRIDGHIILGDGAAGDTIQSLGVFTTDLNAGTTNTYNIGSTGSVWKNVYATNFTGSLSGSINGIGNVEAFSASLDLRLDRVEASASLYDNAMSGSNRLYVSPSGSDSNDGKDPSTPFRTIKAAVESLGAAEYTNTKRYTIYVGSGNYTEENPIVVPPGVAIVGDTLRTVRLTAANPTKDFFHTHDSNYFYGLRFLDLRYPAFAFSFPCSTATATISGGGVSGLTMIHTASGYQDGENVSVIIEGPDASGSVATATATVSGGVLSINMVSNGSGYVAGEKPHVSIQAPTAKRPLITTSPYVQNCSSITGPFNTSGTKVQAALPYDITALQIDEQGAGGGIRIDGNLTHPNSPLESFVADAFTQVNQGGPGHLVINKGYAQFVSCFTTFCTYGFKVGNGGFANISNSVIDFGAKGLVSKTYFPQTYNTGSSLQTLTSTVAGAIIAENGAGYTGSIASVNISGGGASVQATAEATVNGNGSINEIVILTPGSGYTSQPNVTIAAPTGPGAIQATTVAGKANISGIAAILFQLESGSRGVDVSSNMILNGTDYLVTNVATGSNSTQRYVTVYPAPPSITTGDNVYFHQLSNISTGGLVMEYVGSGVTYNALPKYGGVPNRTREIVEYAPGRVFYSTVDNIGNLKIGDFFAVNQLTGEVTIDANQFNLSGLSAIGPFKRNGVGVGVVLNEVSNNTTLLNAQGITGEDTVPTQFAVKTYVDTISGSLDSRLDNIETFTASISGTNAFTASLNNAIQLTGSTVSFLGDIVVYGTQSVINSVNLEVADNMIYLNATSSTTNVDLGIVGNYNDGTYAHTGIFRDSSDGVWRVFKGYTPEPEGNIDLSHASYRYADFYANALSASTLSGIGNVTSYSESVDSRLIQLQTNSGSSNSRLTNLESFTGSQNTKNSTLATYTSSLELYTASVNNDLVSIHQTTSSLNVFTASIFGTNEFTASTKIRLDNLESTSASVNLHVADINTKTGSFETKFSTIASSTSSLNDFTSSQNTKNLTLENVTSSLNLSTASFNTWTGSTFETFSQSVDDRLDDVEYITDLLGGGLEASLLQINAATASLQLFTSSANSRLNNIENKTGSYATTGSNTFNGTQTINGGITTGFSAPSVDGYSLASMFVFKRSGGDGGANIRVGQGAAGYGIFGQDNNGDIVLGTVAGSQGDKPIRIYTNSANEGLTLTNQRVLINSSGVSVTGNVTGTSIIGQILANNGVVSGSSQITSILPAGVVSGSSQINLSSTTGYSTVINQNLLTTSDVTHNNLTLSGNLIVNGTTTTVNSTTLQLGDNIIELNGNGSANGGLLIKDPTAPNTVSGSLLWDSTGDFWKAGAAGSELPLVTTTGTQTLTNKTIDGSQLVALSVANGKLTNSSITIGSTAISLGSSATTIAGLTSVTSTGFTGALTGNASTATTLATARNINGVSFNGSADITVTAAAGTLSGATLASGVTASSLTSVGTLTALTVTGAITANGGIAVTGAITATGNISAYVSSDRRLKNNIVPIENALTKLNKIGGYSFDWTDDYIEKESNGKGEDGYFFRKHDIGVIAQELQEILPEAVAEKTDGYLGVRYEKIIPLLIQSIKELQLEIKELKNSK